ncbi:MAG: T9SS type A sorting domain-containing protein [Bacteroidales bacterium]|nr:T9SS type A sorting domain-containing protein [Bacteroidales bacterium]
MRKALAFILLALGVVSVTRSQPSFPDNGELYVDTVVPVVYITIHPDTLAWIYANPYSDREFHAVFVFDNGMVRDTIEPVGFRLRGNTSRASMKKSFKVSFNTFTPGAKYRGVEKMNLNGEHNDPSVMRAKIMWDLLRKWNIPAPRTNHVRFYINNNYYGLYLNVEHIDEEFAKSRFGNNDGNLFKCLYPADLTYRSADPDSYRIWDGTRWTYELKTNLEENDFSDLAELISIMHGTEDENLLCELDRVFNVQDYLKVMAVQILCGDWDGYIYNRNNYYLYHNSLTGRFEYIPYDVDNTFGIDWFNVDWSERNIYEWQPGGDQERPLYDRIMHNPVLRKQFSFYATRLIDSTLDMDSLIQAIGARREMISPYVSDDPYYPLDYGFSHNDFLASFYSAFGAHVKWGIFPFLEARRISMSEQIEEGTPDPVIKYYNHDRRSGEALLINCFVEAAATVDVKLIYSVAGDNSCEVAMDNGGNGWFSVTLDNIPDDTPVTYQVMASGKAGELSLLPCSPILIAPLTDQTPELFINEFMADNETTVADEHGNYSDWIELYNGDDEPVDLGNLCLTDNFNDPLKWRMPSVILPAGGFTVFWADGTPGLGEKHAPFKLDREGEEIGIYTLNRVVVDTVSFGPQSEDVSMGRKSDGADLIIFIPVATPGRTNSSTPVNTISEERPLILYPNPVSGEAIRLSEATDCSVFSSSGVLIFSGRAVTEVDVSSFPDGMYILVAGDGRTVRFVITRR